MNPAIACKECQLADKYPQFADMRCEDCRKRHINRVIEVTAGIAGVPVEQVKREYRDHLEETL